jgi:hypothetical protein
VRSNAKIAITAAVILGGAVAVVGLRPAADPEFQGRSLRSWLAQAETLWLRGPNTLSNLNQAQIDHAVRQIGTNGLPVLLAMLQTKDGSIKQHIISYSRACPQLPIQPTSADEFHARALLGFKILGPMAGPAVPALVELVARGGDETALLAARALARIGPAATNAVPALVRNLSDRDIAVRCVATNALKRIDPLAALNAGVKVG